MRGIARACFEPASFLLARHADSELLDDQPYEDKARVRVAGPFTVESLAPHRTIAQPERPAPVETSGASYEQTVLDNLKKAGSRTAGAPSG